MTTKEAGGRDPRPAATRRAAGVRVRFIAALLAIAGLSCGGNAPETGQAAGAGRLLAGFAAVDITPRVPVKMAGYGIFFLSEDRCRWSTGVHDPLFATAMALEDPGNGRAFLLIVLDTIGTMIDDAGQVQRELALSTGVPEDAVVVTSTHAHHGPDTVGLYGTILPPATGRDEEVVREMLAGAVRAGSEAWARRVPARLAWAVGEESGLHENRIYDDPDRKLDSTTTLIAAFDARERLLGTILGWACHPTVMGQGNTLLSADFAGVYYRIMAERFGGTHLFVNGAIGASVEPVERFLPPDRWDAVELAGRLLADDAGSLLGRATSVAEPSMHFLETRPVRIRLENPFFTWATRAGLIRRELPPPGGKASTRVTALGLGPLRFATLPGEYVPDYSLRLRPMLGGEAQVIVGLGADWIGYAVTPKQYGNLAYAYERLLCVGSRAGEAVMKGYEALLREAAN